MSHAIQGHSPEDFDWILVQFGELGFEPIIVAGQAVNIWGKYFREWDDQFNPGTPKISGLLPLVSNDMELLEFDGISLGRVRGRGTCRQIGAIRETHLTG